MADNKKSKKEQIYDNMVKEASPNSPIAMDCLKAFVSGGLICAIGQGFHNYYSSFGVSHDEAGLMVSLTLIFLTAVLTGFGLFSKLGKFCGAGTTVPITGFANSMVSPAIEFKKEGWIFGLGAKMFVVAGPVIVYGTLSSMLVGIIYYFIGR